MASNPGLRETAARVDAARAATRQARAGTLPRVGASASSLYQRYSENAGPQEPEGSGAISTNSLGVELTYGLDFWGCNRSGLPDPSGSRVTPGPTGETGRLDRAARRSASSA